MSAVSPNKTAYGAAFARFQELITLKSGHPFRGFDEGFAAVCERYKSILRGHALTRLNSDVWSIDEIGSGAILERAVNAIEIQESRLNLTNNLVFWQNRFGHLNRDHRTMLEARSDRQLCRAIEQNLYDLYCADGNKASIFDRLHDLLGAKYPVIAYLFFLKDIDRFMPIQPTGFDRAFRALGIGFTTLRQCNWSNYREYNSLLNELRPLIADSADLRVVKLIDAHSFCWIFSSLIKQESEGTISRSSDQRDTGRVYGAREKSIVEMRLSIESTVQQSDAGTVATTLKNKQLRMSSEDLQRFIERQLDIQGDRCALTGIRFHFHGPDADKKLFPSADRIDSNGHYELGNIQIVCRFVNFWKGRQRQRGVQAVAYACSRYGRIRIISRKIDRFSKSRKAEKEKRHERRQNYLGRSHERPTWQRARGRRLYRHRLVRHG